MRKIAVILNEFGGICCHENECPFRGECANHYTASDFRSEGGFSPELSITKVPIMEQIKENLKISNGFKEEIHCATKDCNPIYERYSTVPINHDKLSRGEVYVKDGKLKVREWLEGDDRYDYYDEDRGYGDYN